MIRISIFILVAFTAVKCQFLERIDDPNSSELLNEFDSLNEIVKLNIYDNNQLAYEASMEMIKIGNSIHDYDRLGLAHKMAAIQLSDLGLYEDAVEKIYKAIAYYDSTTTVDKARKIAGCYHSLAWFKTYQGDTSQSVSLFHKAMAINTKQNFDDSVQLESSYSALGSYYYLYDDQFDSSEYYFKKSILLHQKLGSTYDKLAQVAVELAQNYIERESYKKSDSIVSVLKKFPQDELSEYIQVYFNYLDGLRYFNVGRYVDAMSEFEMCYTWANEANAFKSKTGQNLLRDMVATAKAGGMYERAFQLLDQLRNSEQESVFKNRQVVTNYLEASLETSRKEQMIGFQEARINFQNRVLIIMGISILIILLLAAVVFITYRKVKQRNLQIETLMRELHHRVKNNLQVISSLLGLQSMQLQNEDAKKAVNEGKERIRAMSLIHQKLYSGKETTVLNFKEYIEILVGEIAQSYGYSSKAIIRINIPEMSLDVDKSMPLGLIVNELVSNAFKYAFEDIKEPILELTMISTAENHYCLTISDNGPGVKSDFDINQSTSFGLKLVRILTKQIRGKLEVENNNGLTYSLNFAV